MVHPLAQRCVLVTGGAGFVGAHVVDALVRAGAAVHVLTRPDGATDRLRLICGESSVRVHHIPIEDRPAVDALVGQIKPSLVYHLAAYGVRAWHDDSALALRINTIGGEAIASACATHKVDRLVWVGSGFEYGKGAGKPMDESAPLAPINFYAATKVAAWELARFHARTAGLDLVTARLFSAYGPAESTRRLIPYVITQALAGKPIELSAGGQQRDYLHVDDIADALIRMGADPSAASGIFNLGSGQADSVRVVAETIASLIPGGADLRFGAITQVRPEAAAMIADVRRLRSLGWMPGVTLRDGLSRTIQWYAGHRDAWAVL